MPENKEKSRGRVGRPPIDKKLKAHDYKISMTSKQMEEIDKAAASVGMTRSEYFRFLHAKYQREEG